MAALVHSDATGRLGQHGRQALAVWEGHGLVVAGVRQEYARQAARRRDKVEPPQIRVVVGRQLTLPMRWDFSAGRPLAAGVSVHLGYRCMVAIARNGDESSLG